MWTVSVAPSQRELWGRFAGLELRPVAPPRNGDVMALAYLGQCHVGHAEPRCEAGERLGPN